MKIAIIISVPLFLFSCSGNKKEPHLQKQDSFLTKIDDSLSIIPDNLPDTASKVTLLTDAAFRGFEKELTQVFGGNIYEAFVPYQKALDTCGLLKDTTGKGYLNMLEILVKENDLGKINECSRFLTDEELNGFQRLVAAFVNTVNNNNARRNPQSVTYAVSTSIERVVATKNFSPQLLIDEITNTLGKNNFDRKICRVAAICYLVSMVI